MKKLTKTKESNSLIVMSDQRTLTISNEEFIELKKLLESGQNKGFIQTRKGEWFNLSFVVRILKTKTEFSC